MPRHPAPKPKPATPRSEGRSPELRRLLIALPDALHHRIKVSCASRRTPMSEAIRQTLARAPWPVQEGA
jgi:hypothetical protein